MTTNNSKLYNIAKYVTDAFKLRAQTTYNLQFIVSLISCDLFSYKRKSCMFLKDYYVLGKKSIGNIFFPFRDRPPYWISKWPPTTFGTIFCFGYTSNAACWIWTKLVGINKCKVAVNIPASKDHRSNVKVKLQGQRSKSIKYNNKSNPNFRTIFYKCHISTLFLE